MSFGTLNFICNFNSSNVIIFNIHNFHFILFYKYKTIFHHCIFFNSFYLILQNNSIIINLKNFYKNILKIIIIYSILSQIMAFKICFFALNAKGKVEKNHFNNNTFKKKIAEFDIFIENDVYFNK